MDDIAELDHIFSRLAERDLLDVMLSRITSLETTLPLEHAATFLAALYQVRVGKRRYGFFESSPSDRVRSITYWYLQRLPEDRRLVVMEEALRLTRGLSLAIRTVQLLTHGPEAGSRALPFFEDQANRDRLNQAGLEAVCRSLLTDSGIPPEQTVLTVSFWACFDHPAAKQWLDTYLTSRSAIVRYLASLVSVSDGSGGVREFIYVASFENLISMEELEARIDRYLNGELTSEEAEVVKLFRKGVKKRREGRDHPSQVWTNEDEAE